MAHFIIPAISHSHRDYIGDFKNNPINIDLCTELISKDEPDGYSTNYPVIEFKGCNTIWYYGKTGNLIRDIQYLEILSKFK